MSELKAEHIAGKLIRDNTSTNWTAYEHIGKLKFTKDGSLNILVVDGDGNIDLLEFSKEDIQNHLQHQIETGTHAAMQLEEYNRMFK